MRVQTSARRGKSFLGLFLLLAPLAWGSLPSNIYVVQKQMLFDQDSATGSVPATLVLPFGFSAGGPTQNFLTLPAGGTAIEDTNGFGSTRLSKYFPTLADLTAAFPSGKYLIGVVDSGPSDVNLNSDNFPVAPQVMGGTWQNGVLIVDPTQDVTLTFNGFPNYGSGSGSFEEFSLTSQSNLDSVSIDPRNLTVSGFGLTPSPSSFSSYTIPAGTLTAGGLYVGSLTYAQIGSTKSSPLLAMSLYTANLQFYVAGASAPAPASPVVTTQPADLTGPLDSTLTFSVGTASTPPGGTVFGWYWNGSPLITNVNQKWTVASTATGSTLTIIHVSAADVGSYVVKIVTAGGRTRTQAATLTIGPAPLPVITTQPQSLTLNNQAAFTLTVAATGVGPFTYQWYRNGVALQGSTQSSFSGLATSFSAGVYTVTVTNSSGTVSSTGATLAVNSAPVITSQPLNQTVATGATAVLGVVATGTPAPTYQWFFKGGPISGATSSRYLISPATPAYSGAYYCTVTNSVGAVSTNSSNLTVITTSNPGRLINLSVLSVVQGSLTMGYVIGGSGVSGSQNLLIRATGPALALPPFNVPGVMVDPTLTVVKQAGSVTLATNAGWGSNAAQVTATDTAVGAFALTDAQSHDSALVTSLPVSTGGYTATVNGTPGYALTEVYDATPAGTYTLTTPRLINLSCLTRITAGGTLTVGFVIGGSTAKTVLIRASGPTLAAAPFSIGGTLSDPKLSVQPLNTPSAIFTSNAGWGGDAQLASVAASVGAFAFASAGSLDSAALVTLTANIPYTVQVGSVSGGAGLVLVEVYEVP